MNGENVDQLLQMIGGKVRKTRQKMAWSQARLAENSGVSLRYLAQIESGKGNISIAVLFKVASALHLTVENLVTAGPRDKPKTIALIGLRGAGKSTLGPLLAAKLSINFVELNALIQDISGLPVNEVFALYGQEGYRRLEFQAVQRLAAQQSQVVVAVAGGIVSETDTYRLLRENFRTIWLRAKPLDHMNRVRRQGDERPMTGNPDALADLTTILAGRESRYAKADHQIETSGISIDETLKRVLQNLEKTL